MVNTFNELRRSSNASWLLADSTIEAMARPTLDCFEKIDDAVEIFGGVAEDEAIGISEEFLALIEMLPSSTSKMVCGLLAHYCEDRPDIIHAWQDETILASSIASIILGIPKILGSARSMRPDEK